MEAHTAATDCASVPIALSGTERLRVASVLSQPSLEPLAASRTGDEDPSRRHPHGGMVLGDVTGDRHELKVRKAVVSLALVSVVDLFPAPERTPKMLFHDAAMLEDVEARAGELNVAVGSDDSGDVLIAARTRAETHVPSRGPAVIAGARLSHRSAASVWWTERSVSCSEYTRVKGL